MNLSENDQPTIEAINISKNNIVVARHVIWAETSAERRRGLLGHCSLEADSGIYIIPTQWIHTFGMKFAIDIAFLSREGQILAIHRDLKPNRLSKIVIRAEGALELSAGRLFATGTEKGDIIQFKEVDANI